MCVMELCKMYVFCKKNIFGLDNIDIVCYTKLCINCRPKLFARCFFRKNVQRVKKITKADKNKVSKSIS